MRPTRVGCHKIMATLITGIAVEDLLTYLSEYEVTKDVIESFRKHSETVHTGYRDGLKVYDSAKEFHVSTKRKIYRQR